MPILGGLPPRNPRFVGREDLLSRLRAGLATGPVVLLPSDDHPLGGTGRTQLAVEYVYRYAETYDLVWWIPAEQSAGTRSALIGLAQHLAETLHARGDNGPLLILTGHDHNQHVDLYGPNPGIVVADGGTAGAGGVFGVAAIVGVVNTILFTALASVSAFIYNISADVAGGIEVTLSERD